MELALHQFGGQRWGDACGKAFFRLPFPAFPVFSTLPERRACGCSLRLKNKSQQTT